MAYLLAASTGFAPGMAPVHAAARAAAPLMAEYSAAVPFLKKPPALDGSMPGDRGFDPLGFTTTITELGGDLNYVREAELMHGRQAMVASVGMVFPGLFGKIPGGMFDDVSLNPLVAQYQLPDAVLGQLVFAIAIAEGLRAQKVFSDAEPGARSHLSGADWKHGKCWREGIVHVML